MISRWMQKRVEEALRTRRGVHLTGARQTGKTTLAGVVDTGKMRRYTMDKAVFWDAARDDPQGFVARAPGETLVIDEVQKVPALLDAVKMAVDQNGERGQYLLTGSANLRFARKVKDTLAGRLGVVRLRGVTLGETRGNGPGFLQAAFAREFAGMGSGGNALDKRGVIREGFLGGYPEPREFGGRARRDWYRGYLDDLATKDIQDVAEIRKVGELKAAALWVVAHSAQFFAMEELAAKAGVAKATAENYLEALRGLYLADRVPAWTGSDYGWVGKRPKWVAADAGLMANLLGWNEEEVYMDGARSGKFVETWVYQQLAALAEAEGGYSLWHYRDAKKREIDWLVEREDGALLGVEVKAGAAGAEDFRHLRWFGENAAKGPFTGVVLYGGQDVLRFGDGYYAVPLGALGA